MNFFTYTTLSAGGEMISQKGLFENELALFDSVDAKGQQLAEFKTYPAFIDNLVRVIDGQPRPLEIAEICNFISLYIGGGLDITASLADLEETNKKPVVRAMLRQVRESLVQGYSVSESFERTGMFPELVVRMARIGEETGDMDKMLEDAGLHIERIEGIRSATKRALIYPLFTLLAMAGGFIFWMAYVVPKLVELFVTMSVDLPWATRVMIAMSEFVGENWLFMLLFFALIPMFFRMARKKEKVRLITDKWLWHMPILGSMIRASQTAFYFQYLALMYESGVVITKALTTVRHALNNKYFAHKTMLIEDLLRQGMPLAESFKQAGVFPPLGVRMVGIGEQTGKLGSQLSKLAAMYFKQLHVQVEVIGKMLEPLIMALVGLFFAFFAIALLGPLYDLLAGVGAH